MNKTVYKQKNKLIKSIDLFTVAVAVAVGGYIYLVRFNTHSRIQSKRNNAIFHKYILEYLFIQKQETAQCGEIKGICQSENKTEQNATTTSKCLLPLSIP